MKKLLGCLLCVMFFVCLITPAGADMLVLGTSALSGCTNPQWFSPTNPDQEEAWLEGLLGLIYDDPLVEFISKDTVPSSWTYAVLKYGVGAPAVTNPDHWAIMDDGDNILQLSGLGLPTTGLSHVSYFGPQSVPEPSTILLLGSCLIVLAGFGRKKFFKI